MPNPPPPFALGRQGAKPDKAWHGTSKDHCPCNDPMLMDGISPVKRPRSARARLRNERGVTPLCREWIVAMERQKLYSLVEFSTERMNVRHVKI